MEREPATIEAQRVSDPGPAQASSSPLADTAEWLEQEVRGSVQNVVGAVQEALEGTRDAVESVNETLGCVQTGARGMIQEVGRVFDVPAFVRRHPWLLVGGALLTGVLAGQWAGRSRR